MRLKITGGRVFDPAQSLKGEVRDLYIDGDRIVSRLPQVDVVMDVRDQAVVPGGIDLRGQVATFGLNFLRLWGIVPSPEELGKAYAILGYTHVHEPYLTLATAAYVHRELAALPVVDVSASLVVNLRDLDLWLRDTDKLAELTETLQFFLEKTRALNFRVVEPWVRHRQEFYAHRTLPLEETLEVLARLAGELQTILVVEASPEVLRAALPEPRAFHLAALGAALTADDLAEAALAHLEQGTSADLGLIWPQMVPGGNGVPVQVDLGLWGLISLAPTAEKGQARRALSLALASEGTPAAFSGAGAVLAPVKHYADFFAWLGDREDRREFWGDKVSSRRYSFFEWVGATRTLPARLLGLADRGHLGPGARADLALFDLPPEGAEDRWPEQVRRCRTLIKAGTIVVDNFRLVRPGVPKDSCFRRTGAESTTLVDELCQYRSFRPENLWLHEDLEGAVWVEV
jgi:formylmethanofuran dehydrogenase subunit A